MCEKNLSQFECSHCNIMNLSILLLHKMKQMLLPINYMKDYLKPEKTATKWGFAPFRYPSWKLYECVRRGRISDLNGTINLG